MRRPDHARCATPRARWTPTTTASAPRRRSPRSPTGQAEQAEDDAVAAAEEARSRQGGRPGRRRRAAADAAAIAAEKDALIGRLAELQDISVDLARERQSALEARGAAAAAAAAAGRAGGSSQQAQSPRLSRRTSRPTAEPTSEPAPTRHVRPRARPDPDPRPGARSGARPAPPAPASGAAAAIAFARAQLGEPYRWGAAGPSAWDCSGLTMGAWAAGGKSLPHYSVAQYEQSTPIAASQLRPGDLVFWGSSSSPSSIYHVALYVGNGTIVHAPRTGRPVTEESMYYWIPPNFYARP